ncbi:Oxalate decarboxylase [Lachnellula willkommii]|uniref:Oxalate decarboxylase n=1 Tax=Lachnellula willkommii TaxID=215461 RepID=A0A559M4G2_9HELO|nr:Oxalate decarboxylase [Lachnellula willkommii]
MEARKSARNQFWPALQDISMYALRIEEDGMREPHWHSSTAEMGYVREDEARVSVMDPDGSVDTGHILPQAMGLLFFFPVAYPQQIEVIGDKEIHFLIFFNQPRPGDVGYRTSATALLRGVLAATFGVLQSQLSIFPTTTKYPLLVGRVNKRDRKLQMSWVL